jgi:hypothetical protein
VTRKHSRTVKHTTRILCPQRFLMTAKFLQRNETSSSREVLSASCSRPARS